MPLPDSKPRLSAALSKLMSLASVAVCYLLIEWISSHHLLTRLIPLPPSLSLRLAWLFEHHIWQFSIGMLAITVLSRGHLWSFGINSSDIRLSMSILLKFYAAAILVIAALVLLPLLRDGSIPQYLDGVSALELIAWILFEWMAVAVADEILYRGLFQTILLKYWREKLVFRSFEFPVVILLTGVGFAAGRTNVPVYGSYPLEYTLAALIGLYCGFVYYRTRSLLTPMLSQAFFYGLPFVLRFGYLVLSGR